MLSTYDRAYQAASGRDHELKWFLVEQVAENEQRIRVFALSLSVPYLLFTEGTTVSMATWSASRRWDSEPGVVACCLLQSSMRVLTTLVSHTIHHEF